MPQVVYVCGNNVIVAAMPTPKAVNSIQKWLKAARRVIPEIPNPATSGWKLTDTVTTLKVIGFHFEAPNGGETVKVLIDRQYNQVASKPTLNIDTHLAKALVGGSAT